MSRAAPNSLDVLRASPVRGQLEPYDPRTPKGSRYIQITDTPDELKVLLPPPTASMYEQLLKLENYELSKKQQLSWERIMEIRHLKDRMIRKCQKLAKTAMPVAKTSSRTETFVFQTFVAPQDFRVKEMEKWFREQQKRGTSVPRRPTAAAPSYNSYSPTLAGPSRREPASSSQQPIRRAVTNPEARRKEVLFYKPLPAIQPSPLLESEKVPLAPSMPTTTPINVASIMSPPPLPVLLLSQREDYGLGTIADQPQPSSPQPTPEAAVPVPNPQTGLGSSEAENSLRPALSRRPSRVNRELKTVSWADNNDLDSQFLQYAAAAREAQASGKWEEVRVLYLEQIAGLESLHLQVKEGLEHLRSETDHLQRIDETIRKQRGALDATFQEFEQKQTLFQEKVHEALTEANEALTRQGLRRDRELEAIHESS
ncbi:hypothetical protein M413DRAFT_439961 [Hebeloma cylindrosporum]|uniref:Uncharacterized protein n=1 Tax=Hebeloma cylindrosporum TaxID=76867 RepID=A0A0C2Z4V9_HEBCY|nr:hypothetical protein M413DRAFT_439961 [Hebeloma cylindrosporum h7]